MRFRSHHKRAEDHLDTAAGLAIAAVENVRLAAEHNDKARDAHRAAIELHSEGLAEAKSRDVEISEWLTTLAGISG